VPTFKSYYDLEKIKEVCLSLDDSPSILVIGAGQGAEAIVCSRYTKDAYILAIDTWKQKFKGSVNGVYSENELITFRENCKYFRANVDYLVASVEDDDLFNKIHFKEWDLIYYDALDGWDDWEVPVVEKLLPAMWRMVKDGGVMMGDDYYIDPPRPHGKHMMQPIIDKFCADNDLQREVYRDRRYWIIWK